MANILAHFLAAYLVLAAPWLGCYWYEKARKRMRAGEPNAKLRLYRAIVTEQIVSSAVILVFWRIGQLPASSLGLRATRFWHWSTVAMLALVVVLIWSGLKLRPKADRIREKLRNGIGLLLPDTASERSWFAKISLGAGISEEVAYRGFLIYYLSTYLPQLNTPEKVVLSALVFGLGHLYQGWKGAIGTGLGGLVFAVLYVSTGSLLIPMVVHAVLDLRVLVILPPDEPQASPVAVGV